MKQLTSQAEIENCWAAKIEVFVYTLDGEPYISGLITGWFPNSDIVYVNGEAVNTTTHHLTTIPF